MGRGVHRCISSREKKYSWGKGEVLPVVELGETTERQAQLVFERQVVLQAAMPGQRAGRGVRNRGM